MPAFTGLYDDEEVSLLATHVDADTFIRDIGASFGFYTLALATMVPRNVDPIAVEPLPANRAYLECNIAAHAASSRVKVVSAALGREQSEFRLVATDPGGCGNAVARRSIYRATATATASESR